MQRDPFGKKTGRNSACWCGSGKKYKHCHLNRHYEAKVHKAQFYYETMSAFQHEVCLCPLSLKSECKGKIVKAHSISSGNALSFISENGHVIGASPDASRYNEKILLESGYIISARKASTFTGFCEYHDAAMFRLLDQRGPDFNIETSFLAAYRALSREVFLKDAAYPVAQNVRNADRGHEVDYQIYIQDIATHSSIGVDIARRELNCEKEIFDEIFLKRNYNSLNFYYCTFESELLWACSSAMNPTHLMSGDVLQDLSNAKLRSQNICVNVNPSKNGLSICFVWRKGEELISEFVEDFRRRNCLGLSLALCLLHSENVFFRPSTWNSFSGGLKSSFKRLVRFGVTEEASHHVPMHDLNILCKAFPETPSSEKLVS